MTNVYVLELENNKYYVGSTDQYSYNENIMSTAPLWTNTFKPVKLLEFETFVDINKYIIKYMVRYGIDNVRGGIFNQFELTIQSRQDINRLIAKYNKENISDQDLNDFMNEVLDKSNNLLNISEGEFFIEPPIDIPIIETEPIVEPVIEPVVEPIIEPKLPENCNCFLSYLYTHKRCVKYFLGY
jgi:hypothetical protein